jgi:hypothetical protein
MNGTSLRLTSLAIVVAIMLAASASQASIVGYGSGSIGNRPVSAEVAFDIVGTYLQITLTNKGTDRYYNADHILTGVAFNLKNVSGHDVSNLSFDSGMSTVFVAGAPNASKLYYDQYGHYKSGPYNISPEWGLVQNPNPKYTLSYAAGQDMESEDFRFLVTATKPVSNQTNSPQIATFPGTMSLPAGNTNKAGLSGADFGLINEESRSNLGIRDKDVVAESVVIKLKLPNASNFVLDNIQKASFTYGYIATDADGTAHRIQGIEDEFVPEPATMAIWSLLGLCWVGMRVCQQRRASMRGPSWNRGRNTRSSVRPPWPEDVREAILEIIDRGCHHR